MGAPETVAGSVRGPESVPKAATTAAPQSTFKRPWMNSRDLPVPWQKRTFCFDLRRGHVKLLDEEWDVKRDRDGTPLDARPVAGSRVNPYRFPELSFDESEALFVASETKREPFKKGFARLYASRLTSDQRVQLAQCPEVYSEPIGLAKKAEVSPVDQAKIDEFWKTVGA